MKYTIVVVLEITLLSYTRVCFVGFARVSAMECSDDGSGAVGDDSRCDSTQGTKML